MNDNGTSETVYEPIADESGADDGSQASAQVVQGQDTELGSDASADNGGDDRDGEEASSYGAGDTDNGGSGDTEGISDAATYAEVVQAVDDGTQLVVSRLDVVTAATVVLVMAVFACFVAVCMTTILDSLKGSR